MNKVDQLKIELFDLMVAQANHQQAFTALEQQKAQKLKELQAAQQDAQAQADNK